MTLYQVRMRDSDGTIQVRHEEADSEDMARIRARDHFGHGEITSVKEVAAKETKQSESKQPEFKKVTEDK